MTKQKLNEHIAEFLGYEFISAEHNYVDSVKKDKWFRYGKSKPQNYDFTKEWHQVVEKMLEVYNINYNIYKLVKRKDYCVNLMSEPCANGGLDRRYYDNERMVSGDTIGEAVCLATIKYLKER